MSSVDSELATLWRPSVLRLAGFSLLTALAIHFLTSWTYPFVDFPPLPEMGIAPKPELVAAHKAAGLAFYSQNSSFLFASIGAILGLILGLTTARRGRWTASLSGGVSGAALGAVGGFGAGVLLSKALWSGEDESLVTTFGIHFAAWAPTVIGAVGGVACQQCGLSKGANQGLGGIVPALLVVAGYCLLTSLFFQNSNLMFLYPNERAVQILWNVLCPLLIGLGLLLSLRPTAPTDGIVNKPAVEEDA